MEHKTVFHRLVYATRYSLQGLVASFKQEQAFRLELYCFIVLFPLGLWLGQTAAAKLWLVLPLFLVLITEILNTAIENLANQLTTEPSEKIKVAKDCGSAAVFLSLVFTVLAWGLILFFA